MARRMAPMIVHPATTEPAGGWSAFWGAQLAPYTGQDAADDAREAMLDVDDGEVLDLTSDDDEAFG